MAAAAAVVITEAAPEIIDQATKILESHHEHLLEAKILWLFSNAKSTSRGTVLLGKGKKLSPEMRFLSSGCQSVDQGYDFIITIYQHQWSGLLATQRTALLDHLLCFCDRKERRNRRTGATSYSWAIRGPDVEEFSEVVERHGLWRQSIKRFAQAMPKQLELPADATIEARLPAGRTTTVDQAGVVVETQLEHDEPNGYVSSSSITAQPSPVHCPHGTPVEDSCAECVADLREQQRQSHEITAKLMEFGGDPRSREELLAELDARDAALDAPKSTQDEAEAHPSVANDSEDLARTESTQDVISEPMPDSWRQRVGLGRGLWGRAQS